MTSSNDFHPKFPVEEFNAASRGIDIRQYPEYMEKARRFSRTLGLVRTFVGPIVITSFVRQGDSGAHGTGDAVDIVPIRAGVDFTHSWMAIANHIYSTITGKHLFGKILNEVQDAHESSKHIHMTLPGAVDRSGVEEYGEVWTEETKGNFRTGFKGGPVIAPVGLAAIGIWGMAK